ncbi:MAG: hypothetical protein IKS20_02710 [Victivallales bacterium]|nr:hypothetical protein [Victivallales bacterium]
MPEDIVEIGAVGQQKPQLAYRTDGSVELPETELLPAKSNEALQASVENLPDDIEPVLEAILKTRRSSYSFLQLFFLILFMVMAGLLTYFLLPHPMNVEDMSMAVQGGALPSIASREMKGIAENAISLYKKKKYNECAKLLLESNGAMNEPLLANIYCEAIYEIPFDVQDYGRQRDYERRAFEVLEQLAQRYPDEVRWPLHRLKLKSRKYLLKDDFHLTAEDPIRQKLVEGLLRRFYKLRKLDKDNGAKNTQIIDLLEAKLLTANWLLKGFSKGYPDDLSDVGVLEREKAYGIAKSYPESRDFLLLRKAIVQKILEGDSRMNCYFFNGESSYPKKLLLDELRSIDTKLEGGQAK